MADRYDQLSPNDVIITLRSLRRRYRSAVASVESDPALRDEIDQVGPDGRSLRQIAADCASQMTSLSTAIATILTTKDATLDAAALRAEHPSTSLASALDVIADQAESTADLLDRQSSEAWTWKAKILHGRPDDPASLNVITASRDMARQAIENLRAAERQAAELQELAN